jgi:hypothetical protein
LFEFVGLAGCKAFNCELSYVLLETVGYRLRGARERAWGSRGPLTGPFLLTIIPYASRLKNIALLLTVVIFY